MASPAATGTRVDLAQWAAQRLHTSGLDFSNDSVWRFDLVRGRGVCSAAEADLPAPEREGRALARLLASVPIGYVPGDLLAGDVGLHFLSAAEREAVEAEAARLRSAPPAAHAPTVAQEMAERFRCEAGYTPAHTCIDCETALREGLAGVMQRVASALEQAGDDEAQSLYRGMLAALRGTVAWARRYGDRLEREAAAAAGPGERERLGHLAALCRRVPERPARTFHEAVQSICFLRVVTAFSEYSGASISLGRLDQLLYPYYARECTGDSERARLGCILVDLWLKLNRFGDAAVTVNLGGLSPDGEDQYNDLTALMLKVSRAVPLPAPLLAFRVHEKTTDAQLESVLVPELLSRGQPTFYGEAACRAVLERRGAGAAEAADFAVNSCMGLVVPGAEFADMWAAKVPAVLALELAINGGKPFAGELPLALQTVPRASYPDFEALFAQCGIYLDELVGWCVDEHAASVARRAAQKPNPFLSALLQGCIERGRNHCAGGVRHYTATFDGFGLVNVADALVAMERLVFCEQRYTLAALVAAAQQDFLGHEEVRDDILACPAYGHGDEGADAMAARVAAVWADSVARRSTPERQLLPAFHTLNLHIAVGQHFGASLDGRRAGAPLAKNIGPALHRGRCDRTDLVRAASGIDQAALGGGQALDLSVDPQELATPAGRTAFRHLLEVYFGRGGLEVQVNGVAAETLRSAMAAPEAHAELQVRIAGFSMRFVHLERAVQEEMCARFADGL